MENDEIHNDVVKIVGDAIKANLSAFQKQQDRFAAAVLVMHSAVVGLVQSHPSPERLHVEITREWRKHLGTVQALNGGEGSEQADDMTHQMLRVLGDALGKPII